jgi:hypothetical protein
MKELQTYLELLYADVLRRIATLSNGAQTPETAAYIAALMADKTRIENEYDAQFRQRPPLPPPPPPPWW